MRTTKNNRELTLLPKKQSNHKRIIMSTSRDTKKTKDVIKKYCLLCRNPC